MNNFEMVKLAESCLDKYGTTFRRWAGLGSGQPWCNAFVSWLFAKSGNADLYCGGRKETYCPHSIEWCYDNLALLPLYLVMPGDVVYFDWQPNGVPDHVGVVKERISDLEVSTIEGNTSGSKVAKRTRTEEEVQGVFRPHFKPDGWSASKKLEIDGFFGYNSIAVMQKWLDTKVDAILGQKTVKKLQKRLDLKQDGWWGPKTSKALQRVLKKSGTYTGEIDGFFGPKSVKAFQRYLNENAFAETWADKANKWAVEAAKKGFHYVVYNSGQLAHECPICHDHAKGPFYGWNCIGFAFAIWHHGGKLGNKCNCGVIDNATWDKLLKQMDSAADTLASNRIGIPVDVIKNGGKALPLSKLKKGDICCLYNGGTALHVIYYMGDGRYADCGRGQTPNIQAGRKLSKEAQNMLKLAVRFEGK